MADRHSDGVETPETIAVFDMFIAGVVLDDGDRRIILDKENSLYLLDRINEAADVFARQRGCKPPPFEWFQTLIFGYLGVFVILGSFVIFAGTYGIDAKQLSIFSFVLIGPVTLYFWDQRRQYDRCFYRHSRTLYDRYFEIQREFIESQQRNRGSDQSRRQQ